MRKSYVGLIAAALLAGSEARASEPSHFAPENPNLVLEFPTEAQQVEELPDGTKRFSAQGTITNPSANTQAVPTILVLIMDGEDRVVFRHEIAARAGEILPGEVIHVTETVGPFPGNGTALELGWKPLVSPTQP